MRNQKWTEWSLLLLTLVVGGAQAQTCTPALSPASTPTSQLLDNGDGTVTDTKTGLMWKQCEEGRSGSDCASGSAEGFSWQQALQRAQTVNSGGGFAGASDWRVPTIKELSSLVEQQCAGPAINLTRFPNTGRGIDPVWSSSAVSGYADFAWKVYFNDGIHDSEGKGNHSPLRLVRSVP